MNNISAVLIQYLIDEALCRKANYKLYKKLWCSQGFV